MDLKIIELGEKLEGYTKKTELPLSDIAHAYLLISRTLYDSLKTHHGNIDELKDGHSDLLKIIECIHQKGTVYSENKKEEDELSKISIRDNRNHTIRSMEFYITEMQNLIENEYNCSFIQISRIALIISIISLSITILSVIVRGC